MIVGIDLGGTKTRIIVEDDQDTVLDSTVPTSSWQRGLLLDDDENAQRLLALVSHLPGADTATVVVGAHGLDNDQQIVEFRTRLLSTHGGLVSTVNDVELVAPAAGLDHAIAVIVGTGSKTVGHRADGSVVSAGGHGFLLSDPGSAASLARDAVRAILDAYDDGERPDELARNLMGYFEVTDVVELSYAFASDARLGVWASLAPMIFTSADEGSRIAASVIDDSARQLAHDVSRVHVRGALGDTVICAGGVITNQPRLYRALTRHIDELELGLAVDLLTVAPVFGAVSLARKLHIHSTAKSI